MCFALIPNPSRSVARWRGVMGWPWASAHGRSSSAAKWRMMAAVASRSAPVAAKRAQVDEELHGRRGVGFDNGPGEGAGGGAGALGPRAAGRVREGEERAPVIRLTIIQLLGDRGVRGPQGLEVVGDPAGGAATKGLELAQQPVTAQAVHRLPRGTAARGQDDGAILEGRRQAPDERDHARAPGGKQSGFLTHGTDDEGGGAGVARVQDAPEGQIVEEERVGLIND